MKKVILTSVLLMTACSSKKVNDFNGLKIKDSLQKSLNKKNQCSLKESDDKEINTLINSLKPSKKGSKFSFNFLETGVTEALFELSLESGTPVVFSENVSGSTSFNASDKSFEEILELITKTGPFDYKKYASHYYVGLLDKDDPSWDQLIYNTDYKLKFIKASKLSSTLSKNFSSYVKVDSQSNTVFINAPRTQSLKILNHIKKIDRPRKQVRIQLTIMELNKKASKFIGKRFNFGTALDYDQSSVSLIEAPTLLSTTKYLKFLYSIKLMQSRGLAKVRATPTIITMEEKLAKFKTTNKALLSPPNITNQNRAEFIEFGTLFQIVPFIVNDKTIRLKIEDSYSSTFNPDTFMVNEHRLDTEVEVKHGESLLIGGMIYEKKEKFITKVPVLGDLPLIGGFFKNKNNKTETTEVLFAIRPKIECLN